MKMLVRIAGADPGFSFGGWGEGGAQKIMCAHAHYERETRSSFRQGSRARLRALEALWVFLCSLVLSEPYFY